MVRSPFADYGHMSNGMEFPLLGELNLNGVPMSNSPNPSNTTNMNTINAMGNNMNMNSNHNNMQQQMQGLNSGMTMINSNSQAMNGNNPITPSSLWGSALPFSFDALMSGNVALAQAMPLVTNN
jgi:hypothetical protein